MTTLTPPFFITPHVRKVAQALYAAQMWNWGQDIRHSRGNVLKEYGFSYTRHIPHNEVGSSEYAYHWDNKEYTLKLWSFAMLISSPQSALLLKRHRFHPLWVDTPLKPQLLKPHDLPRQLKRPQGQTAIEQSFLLLQKMSQAVARYETWVLKEYGLSWREETLAKRPEKTPFSADEIALKWTWLAQELKPSPL